MADLVSFVAQAGSGGDGTLYAYLLFLALVVGFLVLDLGVFHREAHEIKMKEAIGWSVVWLTLGISFSAVVYFAYENHWLGLGLNTRMFNPQATVDASAPLIIQGQIAGWTAAVQYLTGYVVEKSLAMDNIFVIAILFQFFAIPNKYQHRVLFWGIVGALIMRGLMIGIGGELIMAYQWVLIIFGLFLILTSLKMLLIKSESDPSRNPIVKLVKRMYPVTTFFDGQKFFTRRTLPPTYSPDPKTGRLVQDPAPAGSLGRRAITPLLLALIMVEITDLIFAVDSIPAIFAITPDTFIVFTSNILAILGLRALYFCLAAMIAKFRYLKAALIIILSFVGVKLLLMSAPPYLSVIGLENSKSIKIDPFISLAVVVGLLVLATVASLLRPMKENPHAPANQSPRA